MFPGSAPLLAVASVLALLAAPPRAPDAALVPLDTLHEDPSAYLGLEARIVFQVQSTPSSWNPYLTRFGSGDWFALRVWSDEQSLWIADDFDHPVGLVFARRGGDAEAVLREARPYQRYEARVRVAQVFLGRPWLEVVSAQRLTTEVTEGTVLHASRAIQLMDNREWALAREDFVRALAPDLPSRSRKHLERGVELCDRHLALAARRRSEILPVR